MILLYLKGLVWYRFLEKNGFVDSSCLPKMRFSRASSLIIFMMIKLKNKNPTKISNIKEKQINNMKYQVMPTQIS